MGRGGGGLGAGPFLAAFTSRWFQLEFLKVCFVGSELYNPPFPPTPPPVKPLAELEWGFPSVSPRKPSLQPDFTALSRAMRAFPAGVTPRNAARTSRLRRQSSGWSQHPRTLQPQGTFWG